VTEAILAGRNSYFPSPFGLRWAEFEKPEGPNDSIAAAMSGVEFSALFLMIHRVCERSSGARVRVKCLARTAR